MAPTPLIHFVDSPTGEICNEQPARSEPRQVVVSFRRLTFAIMIITPTYPPAVPTPAKARPKMKTFDEGATAQTSDPLRLPERRELSLKPGSCFA
jgi:hypothetical protein